VAVFVYGVHLEYQAARDMDAAKQMQQHTLMLLEDMNQRLQRRYATVQDEGTPLPPPRTWTPPPDMVCTHVLDTFWTHCMNNIMQLTFGDGWVMIYNRMTDADLRCGSSLTIGPGAFHQIARDMWPVQCTPMH
jgi:hypothetical protein